MMKHSLTITPTKQIRVKDRKRMSMYRLVLWFLLTSLVLMPGITLAGGNVLQDISVSSLPGNIVEITLTAQSPVALPKSFATEYPPTKPVKLCKMIPINKVSPMV
jgi:hypothetical protein